MKLSKVLITAALTFCFTSGISTAQELNNVEIKELDQIKSFKNAIFLNFNDQPNPDETGDPDLPCLSWPLC